MASKKQAPVQQKIEDYFVESEDYKHFREWVAERRIETHNPTKKVWTYFSYGPKQVTPLVCLHGLSATADCFYQQLLTMSVKVPIYVINIFFSSRDSI